MTDLLVSSLMADGGLKTALVAAILVEVKEMEEVAEKAQDDKTDQDKPCTGETLMTEQAQMESESKRAAQATTWEDRRSSIPLLYLVRQLLRTSTSITKQLSHDGSENNARPLTGTHTNMTNVGNKGSTLSLIHI